jgi:hypothetical protein
MTGETEGVTYKPVTLQVTSDGHMAADVAGSVLLGVALSAAPEAVEAETITVEVPYAEEAYEHVQKHRKVHVALMVLTTFVIVVGMLASSMAFFDRGSATRTLIVWGISSVLTIVMTIGHKRTYGQDVSCYGRRYKTVGLSIPSKNAADEIKAMVSTFKKTGSLPPKP